MFDCVEAVPPSAPGNPPADGRAEFLGGGTPPLRKTPEDALGDPPADPRVARLKKFKREQLIVDYLNRGVSVAEIAARIGVGEKRMRAIIREILARHMPAPPQEFVAIQVSRLNEALLVAYSAMGTMNLKAVDRVVRIVRELDRYHGFVAAEKRRPAPPPRITVGEFGAPAERAMAFGAAMFCRPEFALQDSERIDFAPGVAMAAEIADRVEAAQEDPILASIREPQQPPPAPARRSPGTPKGRRHREEPAGRRGDPGERRAPDDPWIATPRT